MDSASVFEYSFIHMVESHRPIFQALYSHLQDFGLNPLEWEIWRMEALENHYLISLREDFDVILFGSWTAQTQWQNLRLISN